MSLFPADMLEQAAVIIDLCRARRLTLATAESCTGGLISGCFTEIAGASDVFERGFVTYSNRAKEEMLGVDPQTLARFGAVSKETALEMARGALLRAGADIAIAVTGIASPGGGSAGKPVGLVHLAVEAKGRQALHRECQFGEIGRGEIRMQTLREALSMTDDVLQTAA